MSLRLKIAGGIFILAVLAVSSFLVFKNVFKADVEGAYSISGVIYGQDTKAVLPDVSLSFGSPLAGRTDVVVKTDSTGRYTASIPDSSYDKVYITKDKYFDMEGAISNSGNFSQITANFALKSGFGKENIQIVTVKKTAFLQKPRPFGLALQPYDDSPASLKQIIPDGNSYREERISGNFSNYSTLILKTVDAGQLPEELKEDTAVYTSVNDKYYIIGGKKPDGSISQVIYEYDRSSQKAMAVANLPQALTNVSAVYLPEKKIVMIAGSKDNYSQFYLFNPKDSTLYHHSSLPGINLRYELIPLQDKILLIYKYQTKTRFFTLSYEFINPDSLAECQASANNICRVLSKETNISPLDLYDVTPYYSVCKNKLYLIGGKDSSGTKNTIFELDGSVITNDKISMIGFSAVTQKLIYPVSLAKIYKGGNRVMLMGGYNQYNTPIQNKYEFLDESCSASQNTFTNSGAIELHPLYAIKDYAFVQDNSERAFVFGSNTQTGDSAKYIQKISSTITLDAGNSYTWSPLNDSTLIFRGKAKTDGYSQDIKQGDFFQLTNPYLSDIEVQDIKVTYQDIAYSLADAAKRSNGIIRVSSNYYDNQPRLDVNNPTQKIQPGQFVPILVLKDEVSVAISNNNSRYKIPKMTIDLDGVSVDGQKVTKAEIDTLAKNPTLSGLDSNAVTRLQKVDNDINTRIISNFKCPDQREKRAVGLSSSGKIINRADTGLAQNYQNLFADIKSDSSNFNDQAKADLSYIFSGNWSQNSNLESYLSSQLPAIYSTAKEYILPFGTIGYPREADYQKMKVSYYPLDDSAAISACSQYDYSRNEIIIYAKNQYDPQEATYQLAKGVVASLFGDVDYEGDGVNDVYLRSLDEAVLWKIIPDNEIITERKKTVSEFSDQYKAAIGSDSELIDLTAASGIDFKEASLEYFWNTRIKSSYYIGNIVADLYRKMGSYSLDRIGSINTSDYLDSVKEAESEQFSLSDYYGAQNNLLSYLNLANNSSSNTSSTALNGNSQYAFATLQPGSSDNSNLHLWIRDIIKGRSVVAVEQPLHLTGYSWDDSVTSAVDGNSDDFGHYALKLNDISTGRQRFKVTFGSNDLNRYNVNTYFSNYAPGVNTLYGVATKSAMGQVTIKNPDGSQDALTLDKGKFIATDKQVAAGTYLVTLEADNKFFIKTVNKLEGKFFTLINEDSYCSSSGVCCDSCKLCAGHICESENEAEVDEQLNKMATEEIAFQVNDAFHSIQKRGGFASYAQMFNLATMYADVETTKQFIRGQYATEIQQPITMWAQNMYDKHLINDEQLNILINGQPLLCLEALDRIKNILHMNDTIFGSLHAAVGLFEMRNVINNLNLKGSSSVWTWKIPVCTINKIPMDVQFEISKQGVIGAMVGTKFRF